MSKENSFVDFVRDVLASFGTIRIKSMFGGFGIYCNNIFFAIIADNELYFKGDKGEVSEYFESTGSERFSYKTKDKNVSMEYWKVPDEILDDYESLSKWFDLSYNLALNLKKK